MAQVNGTVKPNEPKKTEDYCTFETSLLTDVLKNVQQDPGLRVTNLHLSHGCSVGDNYMSLIERAYIEYITSNRKEIQKSFIIKRQIEDIEKRKAFLADQVWANEEYMYNNLIPRLQGYCSIPLPNPSLYYSDDKVMVMEDLKSHGFSMTDRVQGQDLEHSLQVMEGLARFHGASLAMQRLDPEDYETLKRELKHPYSDGFGSTNPFVRKCLLDAINVLKGSPLQERYENVCVFLGKIVANQENYIPDLHKPPTNGLAVLIHGDLWNNNIMFAYDEETKLPNEVRFIDYQGSRIGSIGMDLHHFIYTSVQPAIRKDNLKLMLTCYHSCLVNHLKSYLGEGHDEYIDSFTFEKIYNDFLTYRLYGLLSAICMLPMITCDASLIDKNSKDIFNGDAKTTKFRDRLIDVVEEYMRRDWIQYD